ncbi:MAG: CidA/LrgA family protein [Pseudomonadota bacterium]
MLGMLTLIFVCQLIGEVLVAAIGLPVPGPVVGMVLLFCGLCIKGDTPPALAKLADGLLSNLSLLFVPAGVGVMLHVGVLGEQWLPLSVGVFVSTLVTVIVTGKLMQRLMPREAADESPS